MAMGGPVIMGGGEAYLQHNTNTHHQFTPTHLQALVGQTFQEEGSYQDEGAYHQEGSQGASIHLYRYCHQH